MIDNLPCVDEQDVEQAIEYFRRRYGLSPREKKARDDARAELEWMLEDLRISAAIEDLIRRDRYK